MPTTISSGASTPVAENAPVSTTSQCEPVLRKQVRDNLWPYIVLKKGSRNFGLEQKTMLKSNNESCEVGGWLRKAKQKSSGSRQFGEAQFYVMDDCKNILCLIKNDEVKDSIKYSKLISVTAHADDMSSSNSSAKNVFYFRIVGLVGSEQKTWELSPSDTSDRHLVLAWTCALQVRSKTYDVVLDLDHEKALKVALWCQSLYRGFRGRLRADRRRRRKEADSRARADRFGIQRMVSGLLMSTSITSHPAPVPPPKPTARNELRINEGDEESESSTSSDSDVDESGLPDRVPSPKRAATSTSSSVVTPSDKRGSTLNHASVAVGAAISSLRRNMFSTNSWSPPSPPTASEEEGVPNAATPKKGVKFPSDRSLVVPPATGTPSPKHKMTTVEDEIWENQRYTALAVKNSQVYRGWSEAALLPNDRGGYSDRLGTMGWDSLDSVPVPPGWRVVKPWSLDVHSTRCNSEGWTYAQTFASLDSNLASGRINSSASARWLVRRRRWFRVRERETPMRDDEEENRPLMFSGWLGMRGITTGRWTNSYAFLPKSRFKEHLGVALCYLKKKARVFNGDLSLREDEFLSLNMRRKHLRVKFLDNECIVSDTAATRDHPGLFSLHLSGEAEPRILNAYSAEARARWVEALSTAIANSPGPCYEAIAGRRSMRKGAAWELLRASGAMKNMVGSISNKMKHNNYSNGTLGAVQRNESDPEMTSQIESMREELRRNDGLWTQHNQHLVVTPRKFSVDSTVSSIDPLRTGGRPPISPTKDAAKRHSGFFGLDSVSSSAKNNERPQTFFGSTTGGSVGEPATDNEGLTSGGEDEGTAAAHDDNGGAKRKVMSVLKKLKKRVNKTTLRGSGGSGEDALSVVPPSKFASQEFDCASPPASPTLQPHPVVVGGLQAQPTGGEVLSPNFEMPPPYENIMFDGYFDMSVDDWDTFFMREEEFTRDLLTFEKMTDVELDPWTSGIGVGSEHRRRYKMPRVGVVPAGPSLHLLTRTQSCPGKGFVIEQTCSTPEMPWGQHFATDFLNVFAAEGPSRCRVIISQKMSFSKPLMTQSFIKNGTRREVTAYYKNTWTPFVRKWVVEKRSHLLKSGSVGVGIGLAAGPSDAVAALTTEVVAPPASELAQASSSINSVEIRLVIFLILVLILLVVGLIIHSYILSQRLAFLEDLVAQSARG